MFTIVLKPRSLFLAMAAASVLFVQSQAQADEPKMRCRGYERAKYIELDLDPVYNSGDWVLFKGYGEYFEFEVRANLKDNTFVPTIRATRDHGAPYTLQIDGPKTTALPFKKITRPDDGRVILLTDSRSKMGFSTGDLEKAANVTIGCGLE